MSYRFMCDDLVRAKLNRKIIKDKLYAYAYIQVENWLKNNSVTDLPEWMFSEGFVNDRTKERRNGGIKRTEGLTPERRREVAQNGGIKRSEGLTPERRSQIAQSGGVKGGRGRK